MKNKSIKLITDAASKLLKKKMDEIAKLKSDLKAARGSASVLFKFPEEMTISNFPKQLDVKVSNPQEKVKAEITNFKDVQDVHIKNLKDIKVVVEEKEKASGWVPTLVIAAVKGVSDLIVGLWKHGITVKLDKSERDEPIPVVVVDMFGNPIRQQSSQVIIPMGAGGSANGGGGTRPAGTIASGRKTSTTPGTGVPLSAVSIACSKIIITAPTTNGGEVYIGGSTVSAQPGSEQGLILLPTGSCTLDIDNVNKVYIDVAQSGDGVTFTYLR